MTVKFGTQRTIFSRRISVITLVPSDLTQNNHIWQRDTGGRGIFQWGQPHPSKWDGPQRPLPNFWDPLRFGLERPNLIWRHVGRRMFQGSATPPSQRGGPLKRPPNIWDLLYAHTATKFCIVIKLKRIFTGSTAAPTLVKNFGDAIADVRSVCSSYISLYSVLLAVLRYSKLDFRCSHCQKLTSLSTILRKNALLSSFFDGFQTASSFCCASSARRVQSGFLSCRFNSVTRHLHRPKCSVLAATFERLMETFLFSGH